MNRRWLTALVLPLAAACLGADGDPAAPVAPLEPVPTLDVARYMGRWYEIAKFPNWFQRTCVADTQARYAVLPSGQVEVDNRCTNRAGDTDRAVGVARQIGPADSPRFEVRFAPDWLSAIPFLWADYWVVDIDVDYSLVAVSEPRRKYLWILSRTPHVEAADYVALLERLRSRGFVLERLETTPQSP